MDELQSYLVILPELLQQIKTSYAVRLHEGAQEQETLLALMDDLAALLLAWQEHEQKKIAAVEEIRIICTKLPDEERSQIEHCLNQILSSDCSSNQMD